MTDNKERQRNAVTSREHQPQREGTREFLADWWGAESPQCPVLEEVLYSLSGWCLAEPENRHSQETRGPCCLRSGPTENTANTQTHMEMGQAWLQRMEESRGLHGPLEHRGTRGLGLHWKVLSNNELTSDLSGAGLEGGSSFYICFNTFLLGAEVRLLCEMNIWPGLMYLWIWGQAIGSFFSHSNFCWQLYLNRTDSGFLSESF